MAENVRSIDTSLGEDRDTDRRPPKAYLVGGGIASLAAAAFMIRDGDIPGQQITILEELNTIGGSLDGSGSPEEGYVLHIRAVLFHSRAHRRQDSHPGDLRME
jgi:oleate hydratase